MTKIYCDKCQCEIIDWEEVSELKMGYVNITDLYVENYIKFDSTNSKSIIFCKKCRDLFYSWLKGGLWSITKIQDKKYNKKIKNNSK